MSAVDEIRSRRHDPDDPFDQEAARREYRGQRRAEEERDRANVTAGHRAGVDEERERAKKRAEKKPADSKRRPAGRDTKRRSVRRRSSTRRAARQLARPIRSQVSSFTETFGLVLAVIALYQLLTSAPQVSGALNAFSRGFQWLARPDTTVLPTK